MAKPAKKKSAKAAPRKKLTSERQMKLRPHDSEEPAETAVRGEEAEETDDKKKKPKQARLPQMEDPAIEELEAAAEEYAEVRDERQALTTREVALKTKLLGIMHDNKKTEYNHGGVTVKVVVEKEKVRVRIAKDKD